MQTIGRKGENLAAEHLKGKGYEILEQNYRFKKSEIDLICLDDDLLVFVEVKTRSSRAFGEPESFVSDNQKESILKAAERYMLDVDWKGDLRFDIVAIVYTNTEQEIMHLKDAFY
ncbi:YraN family protein [Fabibacter sp. E12]|nr:YraN family protein [Roseivirga sp. E12]